MSSFFTNDYQTLVRYLVDARKKRGMTQVQLAQALRIAQAIVSRMERGERRIDFVEFFHLCALLDVDTKEIYGHLKPRFIALRGTRKKRA